MTRAAFRPTRSSTPLIERPPLNRANTASWLATCSFVVLCAMGCAGGGGGSPPPPPTPQTLPPALRGQSFDAVTATYWSGSTGTDYSAIRNIGDLNGSTTVATSPDGTSISISVNEKLDSGATVQTGAGRTLPPNGSTASAGLEYPATNSALSFMSFGEWNQNLSDKTTQGGFFAFGSVTPGPQIPTTGTATYNGSYHAKAFEPVLLLGFLQKTTIDGPLTANADFGARTVNVTGTNTTDPRFNISGILTWSSGANGLSGSFRTQGSPSLGAYFGDAKAQFFGPHAEELGGTFRLTQPAGCLFSACAQNVFAGSFGGKR